LKKDAERVELEAYLPGFQPRKPSQSYVISLQGIKEISIKDTPFGNDNPTVLS